MDQGHEFELIIMEDGSTDDTFEICESFAQIHSEVRCFHSDARRGKGNAIKKGFTMAKGDYLIFIDADLPVELTAFPNLVNYLDKGYDIVVGSRYHEESILERSPYKTFKSRLYNYIINTVFGTSIKDHQCGFKSFRKTSMQGVFPMVNDSKFFFDTELLIRAKKAGLSIKEISVTWRDLGERKSNINLKEEIIILYKTLEFVYKKIVRV